MLHVHTQHSLKCMHTLSLYTSTHLPHPPPAVLGVEGEGEVVAVLGGGRGPIGDGEDAPALPTFANGVGEVHVERLVATAAPAECERTDTRYGERREDVYRLVTLRRTDG